MDRKKATSKLVNINRNTSERRRSNEEAKHRKSRDNDIQIEETTRKSDRRGNKSPETRRKELVKSDDRTKLTKRSTSRGKNDKEATKPNEQKSKYDSDSKNRGIANGKSTTVEKTATKTRTRRESITNRAITPQDEEAKRSSKTIGSIRNIGSKDTKRSHIPETDSKRNNNGDDYDYEDDFEDYESDFEEDEVSDDYHDDGENLDEKGTKQDIVANVDHETEIENNKTIPQDDRLLEEDNLNKSSLELKENINVDLSNEEIIKGSEEILEKKVVVDLKSHKKNLNAEVPKLSEKPVSYVEHINFDVARKLSVVQQKISKTRMRGEKLLELITLNAVSFSLFSLHPRTYDEFMTNFGNTNAVQAYMQTGDDDIPEETQTDSIVVQEVWTQHPPSSKGAVGGQLSTVQTKTFDINSNNKNWKNLSQFLQKASQVMCTLIEEERSSGAEDERVATVRKGTSFSDKTLTIPPPTFVQDSVVSFTATSKLQPSLILCIYDRKPEDTLQTEENCILSHKNIICVWNIHQPTRPQNSSSEFVFAGLVDGSVAVWDLRETDSLHRRLKDDNVALRAPTYNTAGFSGHEGHHSPVVAILCRTSNDSSMRLSTKPLGMVSSSGGITQLATLEEEAVLCVWVVTETLHQDTAGDNVDLGLAPGGRVHLVKSLAIQLQNLPNLEKHFHSNLQVTDFTCHHQDMNRFYITTNMGFVIMCPVHDTKIKMYSPAEDVDSTAKAVSIRLSIHGEPQCFLVGCSDGSVRLHSIVKEKPLMVWTAAAKGEAVQRVAWSESSPNVFYVLDVSGEIHLWDLCQSDCEPISSTTVSNKRIKHFDVVYDNGVSNRENLRNKPYIVFGCDNGTLEVHYLNMQYSRHGLKEKEMYRKYVELL